jgi:hypothetical protein
MPIENNESFLPQTKLWVVLSRLSESYPTILIQRSSEDHHFNPTVFPILRKNTENHQNDESHIPTTLRHRENIGRIGSLRVFWVFSVIAVFPLKTGDSMFVGFDSHRPLRFSPVKRVVFLAWANMSKLVWLIALRVMIEHRCKRLKGGPWAPSPTRVSCLEQFSWARNTPAIGCHESDIAAVKAAIITATEKIVGFTPILDAKRPLWSEKHFKEV